MKKNILYAAVTIVIVIAVIMSFVYVVPALEKPKKVLNLNTYEKVSSSDLLPNGANHIYFISWYGCPVGADNSWVLYSLLNASTNGAASKDVILHTSISGTPGLLFLKGKPYDNLMENISFKVNNQPFTFTSLYMYNQTLMGTVYNQSIGTPGPGYSYNCTPQANASRITAGLNVIKANLPSSVYNIAKEYETEVPVANHTKAIAINGGNIVTMLIITGPDGTYVHFWFMYPSFTKNVTPQHVFHNYRSYTQITDAYNRLYDALGGANEACG